MTSKNILVGVVLLVVGFAIGFLMPKEQKVNQNADMAAMMHHGGPTMSDTMADMSASLQGKTGAAFDRAFISEMIVHHQGAVTMAELALKNAEHKEIKTMAEAIIAAQTKEIKQMQAWVTEWFGQTNK